MRKTFLSLISGGLFLFAAPKYPVAEIPPTLLPADAVIREYSLRFDIASVRRATETVTFAVTIFSEKEREKGELVLFYDQFTAIDDMDGVLYDANGEEIRELDDDMDVKDYSAVTGYSLHDDTRVRVGTLYHHIYPYTVEYTYTREYNESFSWPRWYAQNDEFPVQSTSFTVSTKDNVPFRFWCNRDSVHPEITIDGSKKIYSWKEMNLPLLPKDISEVDMYDATTIVRIAPNNFEIEGFKGSMESWKAFGMWYAGLLKGKNQLPPETAQEIAAITADVPAVKARVQKVYEFMQSKTRYVSIQLGLGSWRLYDATYVHTRGYGDCKALSNYMQSLLSTVNIASYPVLINSGSKRFPMIREFPSNQFNHVILCVPVEKDTVWLECTNQTAPFGRLGDFTENRPALLISPEGGIVVHTPSSKSHENGQVRIVNAELKPGGSVHAKIVTILSGNQQLDVQGDLVHSSHEDRLQWMLDRLKMPNISMTSFTAEGLDTKAREITLSAEVTLERYASISSNRLFFNPSLLEKRTYVPPERQIRITPVRFSYPYLDIDSIHITLPREFAVETMPKDVTLSTSFGSFTCKYILSDTNALLYVRRTEMAVTSIPAEQYKEYRTFYQEVVKADRNQLVLKKMD